MSPAERIVLLAAAASPLVLLPAGWCRTDLPESLPPQPVDADACWELMDLELLEWQPRAHRMRHKQAWLTDAGLDEAETLRSVLGRDKRRLLRQIGDAGELVRRERDVVVEWAKPERAPSVARPRCWDDRLLHMCYDRELRDLVDRGLVILLAGGTRAVLTGAGKWCAEEAAVALDEVDRITSLRIARPDSDSEAGEGQGATEGGPGGETASEGPPGPSTGVLR
jgi:hypothetical protein